MCGRRIAAALLKDRAGAEPVHDRVATKLGFSKAQESEQCAARHRLGERLYRRAVVGHLGRLELLVNENRVWLGAGVEHRYPVQGRARCEAFHHEPQREANLFFGVRNSDDARCGSWLS